MGKREREAIFGNVGNPTNEQQTTKCRQKVQHFKKYTFSFVVTGSYSLRLVKLKMQTYVFYSPTFTVTNKSESIRN